MPTQIQKAHTFKALHAKGTPLALYNIWDVGTAKIVEKSGAPAIATGSWAVAAAHGFEDGEQIPLAASLANLRHIISAVELPVTIDLESGYGNDPSNVEETVSAAVEAGAVGFNLEDQIIGAGALYDIKAQSQRLGAARRAADALSIPAFLNARTDIFFQAPPDASAEDLVNAAIERAKAYHDVGADGFFAPGLIDEASIEKLCAASPLPVNIMILPNCPTPARLAELGVSRISFGPGPYLQAMDMVTDGAQTFYS